MPGHALAAILSYPELSSDGPAATPRAATGHFPLYLQCRRPHLRRAGGRAREVMAIFPGRYIHVGGDRGAEGPVEGLTGCPGPDEGAGDQGRGCAAELFHPASSVSSTPMAAGLVGCRTRSERRFAADGDGDVLRAGRRRPRGGEVPVTTPSSPRRPPSISPSPKTATASQPPAVDAIACATSTISTRAGN